MQIHCAVYKKKLLVIVEVEFHMEMGAVGRGGDLIEDGRGVAG